MRVHDEIWTVESSRSWTVDLSSISEFHESQYGETKETKQNLRYAKSRNHDTIVAVESRPDLNHGIMGHVASDQNFADLGSTEQSVEMTN
jgi:hypothetical protein